MKILHAKLKDIILGIILDHAFSYNGFCGNARQGAEHLFDYLKAQINEEIYILYLNKCQEEFDMEYHFEDGEPFVKGLMEARYFILRMFQISFSEYFKSLDNQLSEVGDDTENTGRQNRIYA